MKKGSAAGTSRCSGFVVFLGLLAITFALTDVTASRAQVFGADLAISLKPVVDLEDGWQKPPQISRTRCWWWWLNGNVTKVGITRDLEEMKARGLGGANLIDAGGANERGNNQVPHGPTFASPAWQALFLHALAEADRIGLELGLNIQSGWNLGGPTVTPEHAAKKITWAETAVLGGQQVDLRLPLPATVADFYRDVAVLAVPISENGADENPPRVTANSTREDHPPDLAFDNDENTFWVSGSNTPGKGPSVEDPVVLKLEFATPVFASELVVIPREEYGPKRGWLQCADDPERWRVLSRWSAEAAGPLTISFPRTKAKLFRLVIVGAYDPRSPLMPRNAQIAEIKLKDGRRLITPTSASLARIDNFEQKAYYEYPGLFTAAKADHLLNHRGAAPHEKVIPSAAVVDLGSYVDSDGQLRWNAPRGNWKILRFGYTLSGARVSTSSEGWNGWAIDYLDPGAFDQYWHEVTGPLLEVARPYLGRTLKFLHTDSWELGPVNWTPALPEEFQRRRGYDLRQYLPALAGYVVQDRETSNRFLNDFRRTLADLIANGKYAAFQRHAHELGLAIHPESGGPHAAPIDALMCLGRNDIPMGELWARSPNHRMLDSERFFTKQAASAAHIYGKRVVLAESFTSIGPQWEEDPRSLKPVFDQAACEGLNLVMLHTFDSSPDEMGEPGQAYFAGTHINRHTTWWPRSNAFFAYLNRCQFMLQQGLPVADVLYFYGENVPAFVRWKGDDPAKVLPGYDYDVINLEALAERTSVRDGSIVLPEGTMYRTLVLPDRDCYGLRALQQVERLLKAGATIVGPKPTRPIGLSDDPNFNDQFGGLADRLWEADRQQATSIQSQPAREVLRKIGVEPDFTATTSDNKGVPQIDYIHRRTNDADIYLVVNRTDRGQDANCSFRITAKQPELWDPVSGARRDAGAFSQVDGRTSVPLSFPPHGSMFVVFRRPVSPTAGGEAKYNEPRTVVASELTGPWQVQFESRWHGPTKPVTFDKLASWTKREEPDIRYYSGPAVYRATFDLPAGRREFSDKLRWWLDLGGVKNIAAVRLNGSDLGVAWTDPFRVELTGHLQATENKLEIEVTNLWPNRLVGDQQPPAEKRFTRTNIIKFRRDSPLLESGLLGPIRLMREDTSNR